MTHRPVVGSGWQEDFNKLFTKADGYTFYRKVSLASDYEFDEAPQKMDSEGRVSFGGLSIGLYLVMQAEKGTGDKEFTITPFLVSIPYRNADGSLLYDVDSSAKPTRSNAPTCSRRY